MLTDRHARGQPSTCVRHKDLSCLTTGCPAQHVALVTKPALLGGAAFISLRNIEDDVKVLSKMSSKVASSFKGPWMYMAHGFLC